MPTSMQIIPPAEPIGASVLRRIRGIDKENTVLKNMLLSALCHHDRSSLWYELWKREPWHRHNEQEGSL